MSWDKETIVTSEVDATINVLKHLGVEYTLAELGQVPGCGLNDSDEKMYSIRRLQYNGVVVLEQMWRTCNCDTDDTLVSCEFSNTPVPEDWPVEIDVCCEEL